MTGLVVFVVISIFLIAMIPHRNKKFYFTKKGRAKGEAKAAEKEAQLKQFEQEKRIKYKEQYGNKPVVYVDKNGSREFKDIFELEEALVASGGDINYKRLIYAATKELQNCSYTSKNELEQVKCKVYFK